MIQIRIRIIGENLEMRIKPLGFISHGVSYIRMDLEDIGINAGNWDDSAQDRNYWRALVNAALNLRVP